MLSVEKITAGYLDGINILNDVSLNAKKGMITGVIGPNGAGKSTLLKTVFGFLRPRQGRIRFENEEIQSFDPYRLKRMGISYMPQEFNTFPQLTVRDNLLLGAWTFKKDRNLIRKRLEEVYEFFPLLGERQAAKATYLSGGILRMLSLGKEIMTKPKLFLVDEPSAGIAPVIVKDIYSFLVKIAEQGTTILIVDQNIVKALEISHYMYLFEMGQVKQMGPKKDFAGSIRNIIRESIIDK
jgi:ABC-type branched-subunit amino acid transport system ATPase component